MLRARAAERGLLLQIVSRGLSLHDQEATREAARAATARGGDLRSHRSAILAASDVAAADIIIGMERQHVREAVVLDAGALSKSFTLKELVRRAEETGQRASGEALRSWLERVGAGRRVTDLVGFDPEDEIADPYRRPMAEYDRCADEIAALIDRLLALGWPLRQTEGAA